MDFVAYAMTVVAYCRPKNSVQYVLPDGFFGIQIVQNQFWLGLRPGPCWGIELTM